MAAAHQVESTGSNSEEHASGIERSRGMQTAFMEKFFEERSARSAASLLRLRQPTAQPDTLPYGSMIV